MSISAIKISELEGHKRQDAEYYQPNYLEAAKKFEGFKALADYKPLILHPTEVKRIYDEEGLQLLFTQNIRGNFLDFSHVEYLPFSVEEQIRKNRLQPGDVVVTRTGANYGDAAPYDGNPSPIYASAHCIIIRCKDIPGGYLSTYFNTDIGKALLKRGVYGAAQPEIAPDYIRTLRIPRFGEKVEKQIEQKLLQAKQKRDESERLYAEAERFLAAELGLDQLDLSESLFNVRRVSDVINASRLDAEYFKPKYERVLDLMRQSGKKIGDVAHLAKRRFEPAPGKLFNYIEISDLSGNGQTENQIISGEEAPSRAQWIVRSNDVITSTVRPIRRLSAIIEREQEGFVCSSGFAVLQPKSIKPEVLLLYLRLPVVCEIMDLYTTASMYPAISTDELLNLPIAMLKSESVAEQLVDKVRASRQARQDAKRLLAEAKAEVERLIEG